MHYLKGMPYFFTLDAKILGFECIKDFYIGDFDFSNVFNAFEKVVFGKFFGYNGFLFRENKLCVLFISNLLVREAHGGGLIGHFGISKL